SDVNPCRESIAVFFWIPCLLPPGTSVTPSPRQLYTHESRQGRQQQQQYQLPSPPMPLYPSLPTVTEKQTHRQLPAAQVYPCESPQKSPILQCQDLWTIVSTWIFPVPDLQ